MDVFTVLESDDFETAIRDVYPLPELPEDTHRLAEDTAQAMRPLVEQAWARRGVRVVWAPDPRPFAVVEGPLDAFEIVEDDPAYDYLREQQVAVWGG